VEFGPSWLAGQQAAALQSNISCSKVLSIRSSTFHKVMRLQENELDARQAMPHIPEYFRFTLECNAGLQLLHQGITLTHLLWSVTHMLSKIERDSFLFSLHRRKLQMPGHRAKYGLS
jgi:hypothetical protein